MCGLSGEWATWTSGLALAPREFVLSVSVGSAQEFSDCGTTSSPQTRGGKRGCWGAARRFRDLDNLLLGRQVVGLSAADLTLSLQFRQLLDLQPHPTLCQGRDGKHGWMDGHSLDRGSTILFLLLKGKLWYHSTKPFGSRNGA